MLQNMCVEIFIEWGWEKSVDPVKQWNAAFEGGFFMMFLYAGLLAPLLEEFIFRFGAAKLGKLAKLRNIFIILISSALFMVWHWSFSQAIYQFIMGVIFMIIYLKTNNIWWTVLIHFINNVFIVTYTYLTGPVASTFELSFGNITLAVVFAAMTVLVVRDLIKGLPNAKK